MYITLFYPQINVSITSHRFHALLINLIEKPMPTQQNNSNKEPSFSHSVDILYDHACGFMDITDSLKDKLRVTNSTYTVRFGVKLRGEIHTFTGYHAAKFLSQEDDYRIIAIIERDGAIIDQNGIDVEALKAHITERADVKTYPHGEYIADGPKVLELGCDILIPAELEAVINLGNTAQIQAPLFIEGANGPVTAGADKILRDKGTVIIPDMYANAGGVTVSYFEWVKNLSHIRLGRMQRREEEARH